MSEVVIMIDPTLLLFVVIVIVVLTTSLLKLPWFSEQAKVLIATVVSVVGAGVHVWFTGDFDVADLTGTALQVFGGSQLIYKFLIEGTSSGKTLDDKLEHVGAGSHDDVA
jgi:hypothetical protein